MVPEMTWRDMNKPKYGMNLIARVCCNPLRLTDWWAATPEPKSLTGGGYDVTSERSEYMRDWKEPYPSCVALYGEGALYASRSPASQVVKRRTLPYHLRNR